jgi:hypothetical protein
MNLSILKISMECPYCLHQARLKITSINREVRCFFCKVEFVAKPFPEERDLLRMTMACTRTKRTFGVIWERDGLYKFRAIAPATPLSKEAVQKIRAVSAKDVEWGSFRCPDCGDHRTDHCACELWLCGGISTPRSDGGRNTVCPRCGPWGSNTPVMEVPVFNQLPMQGAPPRLALPAATAVMKVRP